MAHNSYPDPREMKKLAAYVVGGGSLAVAIAVGGTIENAGGVTPSAAKLAAKAPKGDCKQFINDQQVMLERRQSDGRLFKIKILTLGDEAPEDKPFPKEVVSPAGTQAGEPPAQIVDPIDPVCPDGVSYEAFGATSDTTVGSIDISQSSIAGLGDHLPLITQTVELHYSKPDHAFVNGHGQRYGFVPEPQTAQPGL